MLSTLGAGTQPQPNVAFRFAQNECELQNLQLLGFFEGFFAFFFVEYKGVSDFLSSVLGFRTEEKLLCL